MKNTRDFSAPGLGAGTNQFVLEALLEGHGTSFLVGAGLVRSPLVTLEDVCEGPCGTSDSQTTSAWLIPLTMV